MSQERWPPIKNEPDACFLVPDGKFSSDRSVAGPLRMGTASGTGPNGPLIAGRSDMGMDKLSPRRFDVMGSHNERSPPRETSRFISKEIRGARKTGQ